MEVSGYDGNKVLWVVLYDHVFEDPRKMMRQEYRGLVLIILMYTRGGGEEKD